MTCKTENCRNEDCPGDGCIIHLTAKEINELWKNWPQTKPLEIWCIVCGKNSEFVRKWISVKERLPEINEEILCYTEMGDFVICAYTYKNDFLEFYSFGHEFEPDGTVKLYREKYVTYWSQLPESPKDKS